MSKPFSLSDLAEFTGAQHYYRHGLMRDIKFTDGVAYLAENAGAHWLVDKVATLQLEAVVRAEEFQVWNLAVTGSKAELTCDDGDGNIVHREEITFTDFPEPGVKLYFGNGVILLPSEY